MSGVRGFIIKLIISVGLMTWLIYSMHPENVWAVMQQADLGILALAFVLFLLAISLGSYKWGVLLRAQDINVALPQLIRSTFVGLFFGNFLPSNVGGDVVRAFDLNQVTANGPATSTSVIVDRMTGLIVFLGSTGILGLLAAFWLGEPGLAKLSSIAFGLFLLVLTLFLAMVSSRVSRRGKIIFQLVPQLNPFKATAKRVAEAFNAYRHRPGAVIHAALVSFAIQCLTSVVNWLVFVSLGIEMPFQYVFVFNSLIAFVLLVPISINGIGVQQAVYVYFYSTVLGIAQPAEALAMSILMHAIIITSGLLGGLVWLQSARKPRAAAVAAAEMVMVGDPAPEGGAS